MSASARRLHSKRDRENKPRADEETQQEVTKAAQFNRFIFKNWFYWSCSSVDFQLYYSVVIAIAIIYLYSAQIYIRCIVFAIFCYYCRRCCCCRLNVMHLYVYENCAQCGTRQRISTQFYLYQVSESKYLKKWNRRHRDNFVQRKKMHKHMAYGCWRVQKRTVVDKSGLMNCF